MILREKLNSLDNFNEIIQQNVEYIEEEKADLSTYDLDSDNGKIILTYKTIYKYQLDNVLANYSVGTGLEEHLELYLNLIGNSEKIWKISNGYVQMIWMLSIGIMLKVEDKYFDILVKLVERDNVDDYLINFLIRYRKPDWQFNSSSFEWAKPYKALKEVVEIAEDSKQKAVDRLQIYLKKEWYKGHSDCGWYNAHKSKWNIHSGYWSFESGAIAKILGLDDSILKDQQYYPYDMVHWKDS